MISHDTQIRVRYGEVDRMGFLYHAHYVDYFDVARTQMLRDMGLPYTRIEAAGIMMPVMDVTIRYIKAANYDDLLTVRTTIKELPSVKLKFYFEVFRPCSDDCDSGNAEKQELITTGSVTIAFMNSASKRACRAPQSIIDILKDRL